MSDAKKLLETFEGSGAAHGTTVVGRVGRNGKAVVDRDWETKRG
jgi:hypothetical protein